MQVYRGINRFGSNSKLDGASMNFAFVPSVMKVRLTRKHADRIDGVDLRGREPGDLLDLSASDARLLLRDGRSEVVR